MAVQWLQSIDLAGSMNNLALLTASEISQRLKRASEKNRERPNEIEYGFLRPWFKEEARPAAVLLPLFFDQGEWHLLFIRRPTNMEEHSGQVAFPGGRVDAYDASPEVAALREAHEEIGLRAQDVRILGSLKRLLTVTNYSITPFVGLIPWPYQLNPSPHEVSRVFSIPLNWLADKQHFSIQSHHVSFTDEPVQVIVYHEYQGEVLWGASARIVHCFLDALTMFD